MTNSKKLKHDLLVRGMKYLMAVLNIVTFAVCWNSYYSGVIYEPFYHDGNLLMILLYAVDYLLFAKVYDAMQISMTRVRQIIYSQALTLCFSDAVIYILIAILARRLPNLLPGIACLLCQIVLSAFWSYLSNWLYFVLFDAKKTAII